MISCSAPSAISSIRARSRVPSLWREGQQPARDLDAALACPANDLQHFVFILQRAELAKLGKAMHARQQVIELMSHAGSQRADRHQFGSRDQLGLRALDGIEQPRLLVVGLLERL